MEKYSIKNEKEIVKNGYNLNYPVGLYLKNMNEYVNKLLFRYAKMDIEPELELIVDNNKTFITLSDKTIYKPMCNLFNVSYKEMADEDKLNYYKALFNGKLIELGLIKTEIDLIIHFPEIYAFYDRRKEKINDVLDIYRKTSHVYPTKVANETRRKELFKNKIDEKLYNQLLMEANNFNLENFIQWIIADLQNLLVNFPALVHNASLFAIDVNLLPSIIDYHRLSTITESGVNPKR